jgi:hypothetical protein
VNEARLLKEIVVEDADRVGVLANISRLLSDMGINLLSVYVSVAEERAEIHLVTVSQTYALDALREAGFTVEEREVVLIELPHHPGFLCRITEALARREITIHQLYATVPDGGTTGLVVLTCSNNLHALQLLRGR